MAAPDRKTPGPSVKDDEMYEALRREGNSKEKSARIANAAAQDSRSDVGERGGHADSYEDWTVDQLRKRAAELDIAGRSEMNKDDLIAALRG
ncbi:Rho termination factor N-terminal domain-containing protein [Brevibacterium luteolum]|uniref:Rho termination factor N-terminal domain-containing protein n=1 Tax=Brevibacterium luteolum TaxID=199591 RepID=UPI00223AD76E|nr:Rho termination factor N-terminal domain-containing protein [Brevibacterium luteolum]MCT1829215.1 Rho termination factor N-terminal domain-containing protein [Brevibacterium luteolum]